MLSVFPGVRVPPPLVALAMFGCCLLSGMGARWLFDAGAGPTPAHRDGLVVHVRDGHRAVHVQNLTDLDWAQCVATVESGAVSPPFALGAGGAMRVPLAAFRRGDSGTDSERHGEGSLRTTSIVCRGAGGAAQQASLR